jgi:hypothetical protein
MTMNALCIYCPYHWLCEDDNEVIELRQEKNALLLERAILRDRLIDAGLESGASIYMHGQRIDVEV